MTSDPNLHDDALAPELEKLLGEERQAAPPPADAQTRVLSRLEQTLGLPPPTGGGGGSSSGGGAPGGGAPGGAAAGGAAAAGLSKAGAVVLALGALAVGAGAGALGHASLQAPPAPSVEVRTVVSVVRVPETAPPVAMPSSDVPMPVASSDAAAAASSATNAAKPLKPRGSASALGAEPSERDRALAEENALISRAQAALARGNAAQARAALREHATRFPSGQLITERKLLEAYTDRVEKGAP